MDERTTAPERARPRRRRRGPIDHHAARRAHERQPQPVEEIAPQAQGGDGSFGGGPVDDGDGHRKPERPNNDSKKLLVVLGLLALGAGVMSARLLTTPRSRRGVLRR